MILRNEKNLARKLHGDKEIIRKYRGDRLVWEKNNGGLPSGYKRCKYLENSGKQYINTMQPPSTNDLVSFRVMALTAENTVFFGVRQQGTSDDPYQFYLNFNPTISSVPPFLILYFGSVPDTSTRVVTNSINGEFCELKSTLIKFKQNVTITRPVFLFGFNVSGRLTFVGRPRIDYFKIEGKCDFLAALDPSGKPCMYDTVTKQPFYNSGTGEFGYELMDGTYVAPI